jgi:hypothetical protein
LFAEFQSGIPEEDGAAANDILRFTGLVEAAAGGMAVDEEQPDEIVTGMDGEFGQTAAGTESKPFPDFCFGVGRIVGLG